MDEITMLDWLYASVLGTRLGADYTTNPLDVMTGETP